MPAADELLALATCVTRGIVAALVSEDEVHAGRRLVRDFDNVMFTPADPQGSIPWRDGFFTLIWACGVGETAEVRRVLSASGAVVL